MSVEPLADPRLQLFELLSSPVWITDPELARMVWANRAAVELWCAENAHELVNRDLNPSPTIRMLMAQLRDRVSVGERIIQDRTIYPKGHAKRVEMCITAFPAEDGRVLLLVEGRVLRVLDPDAVRASEAVRHAPLVVATFALDGAMLQANTLARAVFGNQLTFQSIFAHSEEAEHALARASAGETLSEDVEVMTTSGARWHAIELRRVLDPVTGQNAILMSAHDMTARIEAEEAKEDLISVVSHELRTPITAIRGALELIIGGVAAGQPGLEAELMQIASENTARLSRLVDDLLDVRKLSAGGISLQSVELSILPVIKNAIAAMTPGATLRAVDIVLHTAEDLILFADSGRIEQVMINLLSNACKHSPPGGVVSVTVSRKDSRARVEVQDQGPGVPEVFRSKLFLRFSQADTKTTRSGSGTGLGLYISKTIVELHGGTLGFESPEEGGAMFYFELPLKDQK